MVQVGHRICRGMLGFLAGAWCGAATCVGAPPTREEVRTWLTSEVARAQSDTPSRNCRIVCRYEQHWFPLQEQLTAMREAVAGHPDHPDLSKLATYDHRKAGTPTRFLRTVWIGADHIWRLSEDFDAAEFPSNFYSDVAQGPSVGFFLSPQTLSLIDPGSPPTGKDLRSLRSRAWLTASMVLDGGLYQATLFDAAIEEVRIEGSRFEAMTRVPDGRPQAGRVHRLRGEWDDTTHRGLLREIVIIAAASPIEIGKTIRVDGWRFNSVLNAPIAEQVSLFGADGRLEERYISQSVEMLGAEQIAEVVAPPVNGRDAFRGQVAPSIVHDHVHGQSTVTRPDGRSSTIPLNNASSGGSNVLLRPVAWGLAAISFATLVAIKIWRFKQNRVGTSP